MARPPLSFEERNRIFENLITTTYHLLEAFGFSKTTVRKVAEQAGCKTSTIYNYFDDAEHLGMYASMKYLSSYNLALAKHVSSITDPLLRFYSIWDFFNYTGFEHPEAFHRLFYGKHCDKLQSVIQTYYEVFPHELDGVDEEAQEMLGLGSLLERNRFLIQPLVDNNLIAADEADLINEITTSCFRDMLERKIALGDELDNDYLVKRHHQQMELVLKNSATPLSG